MNNIYFTINVNKAGFTDQLSQFSIYYALGMYLEFNYLHTPLRSFRSNTPRYNPYVFISKTKNLFYLVLNKFFKKEDIFDHIGINKHFDGIEYKLNNKKFENVIEIHFFENFIEENNIKNFEDLKEYILKKIQAGTISQGKNILIKFVHVKGMKQTWWIEEKIGPAAQYLDIKNIYNKTRVSDPVKSLFPDNEKTNILIHIRQGDIGIIETPWNTFIPVAKNHPGFMKEHSSVEDINNYGNFPKREFCPFEFHTYIKGFLKKLPGHKFSIRVFSDGYIRSFDIVVRNIKKLNLDRNKKKLLLSSFENYEKKQFGIFNNIENCECVIGETGDKLKLLIRAAIDSDIILCSEQQYMIPKLTMNLCEKNKPAVVILTKSQNYIHRYMFKQYEENFIFEEVLNKNYDQIIEKLNPVLKI